ncbi:MAG: DUF5060 domain-containing protein [Spirochaetes bacterium]|nr:DUF5060 domain-containing protein [Spirochaetota bacterium]
MSYLRALLACLLFAGTAFAADFAGFQVDGCGNLSVDGIRFVPTLFEPGWTGTVPEASSFVHDAGFPKLTADAQEYAGAFKLRKAGKAVRLGVRLERVGERSLTAVWRLENPDGLELLESWVNLVLPLAMVKGKALRVDGKEAPIPENFLTKNPIPTQAACRRLEIPLAEGRLVLAGTFAANFQDDRVFKGETFTIRLRIDPRSEALALSLRIAAEGDGAKDMAAAPVMKAMVRPPLRPWAQENALSVSGFSAPEAAQVFGRYEADLEVKGTFQNPFDPEDLEVRAVFTSPTGNKSILPAFFYRNVVRSNKSERLEGEPYFKVRFTPTETGSWTLALSLKDRKSRLDLPPKRFSCTPAAPGKAPRGFVRLSKANPNYFAFDDGSTCFPVGENVCWGQSLADYDEWFDKLAAAGGNFARIWVGPFDLFTLERIPTGSRDAAGLVGYDLLNAWRMDYVLDLAARKGITILFCIDSFNSFASKSAHGLWDRCPYNAEHGGPCAGARDFFTEAAPKAIFKKRLSYIVARYGHHPAVFAWEFFNEVEQVDGFTPEIYRDWHREMARFLRGIDPYGHLQTTGWGHTKGEPLSDALPEMDFLQSHSYSSMDSAEFIAKYSLEKAATFQKPHFFGEFGLDTKGIVDGKDGEGIHLHNGLWAGIFTLSAGTGMLWWWNTLVNPSNLYHRFAPPAAFVKEIPFASKHYAPAAAPLSTKSGRAFFNPVSVKGLQSAWGPHPSNRPQRITVAADGTVTGAENLSRNLHGKRNHADWNNPATFFVECAREDRFGVVVAGVSTYGGAILQISVDGVVRLVKPFTNHAMVQSGASRDHDGLYAVPLSPGKHEVTVDNLGADWFEVSYEPVSVKRSAPPLFTWALVDAAGPGPAALLWIKDPVSSVENMLLRGERPARFEDLVVSLRLPDGEYRLEWWNTWTGALVRGGQARSQGGVLRLEVPGFERDVALKVMPGR